MLQKSFLAGLLLIAAYPCYCWGFFAHRKINYYAVFLLPPKMLLFYKTHINFLSEHAVDADKRRYAIPEEGARHYIDLDEYGDYPFDALPRTWAGATEKFGEETLREHGIVPWHVEVMHRRLTYAFREKNFSAILKTSADLAHYVSDAHVPLHTTKNYNGQLTNQHGIHGFWESRLPELFGEASYDFFIGPAQYLEDPLEYIWDRVLESSLAADSVLRFERELSQSFGLASKYSFEERNGVIHKQYSSAYSLAYDQMLGGMVERRMRQSIFSVASFWFTAWVNAGQPNLNDLVNQTFTAKDLEDFERLNESWRAGKVVSREHEP